MKIIFDCSQFLVGCNPRKEIKIKSQHDDLKNIFNEWWGKKIFIDSEISEVKLNFVRGCLNSTVSAYIFLELQNEEFIGEFEDWKKVEHVPQKILNFEKSIKTFVNYGGFEQVYCFLVSSVSTGVRPYITDCTLDGLRNKLWIKSHHYFGDGAYSDILIIRIKDIE